jgi:large subunit ribosomal protein L29
MKVFELREKTREELHDMLNGLYRELFNLRLRRGAQELPNPLRLRTLRREIARIQTVLREDELGVRKLLVPKKVAPRGKKGDGRA